MGLHMAKDWNVAYEAKHTPWDKGSASPPLSAFLEKHPLTGRVLVPGCGLGYDARLLARQGASVVGLDIAPSAVRQARALPAEGELSFEVGDFLNLAENYHGQFDTVVEHTCLCALDPAQRLAYVRSVLQALKPDGHYLAVFFRKVKDYCGEAPRIQLRRSRLKRCSATILIRWNRACRRSRTHVVRLAAKKCVGCAGDQETIRCSVMSLWGLPDEDGVRCCMARSVKRSSRI